MTFKEIRQALSPAPTQDEIDDLAQFFGEDEEDEITGTGSP